MSVEIQKSMYEGVMAPAMLYKSEAEATNMSERRKQDDALE